MYLVEVEPTIKFELLRYFFATVYLAYVRCFNWCDGLVSPYGVPSQSSTSMSSKIR